MKTSVRLPFFDRLLQLIAQSLDRAMPVSEADRGPGRAPMFFCLHNLALT
jgi:hypothetical protein